jgi:hypothetical protein
MDRGALSTSSVRDDRFREYGGRNRQEPRWIVPGAPVPGSMQKGQGPYSPRGGKPRPM